MMTDIEKAVSSILTKLGYKYYEQCEFYPYIVDFYLPEFRIAIEADGSVWHNKRRDRKRDVKLIDRYSIRVIHFVDDEILKRPDLVEQAIKDEIEATICRRL
jgi:very-short-patch-repair endonuclease